MENCHQPSEGKNAKTERCDTKKLLTHPVAVPNDAINASQPREVKDSDVRAKNDTWVTLKQIKKQGKW